MGSTTSRRIIGVWGGGIGAYPPYRRQKQKSRRVDLIGVQAPSFRRESAQIVLMDENLTQLTEVSLDRGRIQNKRRPNLNQAIVPNTLGIVGTLFFGWGYAAAILENKPSGCLSWLMRHAGVASHAPAL